MMPSESIPNGLIAGADTRLRCSWCGTDPLYCDYHDREWGFPVRDERRLFEKIVLEGFQAGLSWLTILRKREHFRAAFANFEREAVARFTSADVDRLLGNSGIIRHRGKIEAAIHNAGRAIALADEFGGLAPYLWRFRPAAVGAGLLTQSPESVALSKDLKARGWKFVGPTTIYAFMQAMGLVNDHREGCHVRAAAQKNR